MSRRNFRIWSVLLLLLSSAPLDVGGEVDLVGQLGDVHLEAVLNLVQHLQGQINLVRDWVQQEDFQSFYLGVGLVRDEGDGESLGAEPPGAGHPVQVGVRVLGHVVVEHDVHALDVHAAAEQVRRHQDTLKKNKTIGKK